MEWLKRLNAAIDYIESNLDNDISYDEAARIACCSSVYFQRIFSYVSGISLSEYIRRRRMTQAAFELQRTDEKVINIALKYGYTSPTSFNRAFQSVHNLTPSAARNIGSTLNAYPAIRFAVKVTGGDAMSYHIAEKGSMRMVGVRIPLSADMEENQKNIPQFWQSVLSGNLFSEICKLANRSPQGILGVSVYENPKSFFTTSQRLQMRRFLMVCLHLKYRRLYGRYLKMTAISKKRYKAFSKDFIRSGCHFQDMNMPDSRT